MALVAAERFAGKEIVRVYLAGRRAEAARVERCLTERAVDYAIDRERYRRLLLGLFPVEYDGVAFYVLEGQAEFCRRALAEAGLRVGLAA